MNGQSTMYALVPAPNQQSVLWTISVTKHGCEVLFGPCAFVRMNPVAIHLV